MTLVFDTETTGKADFKRPPEHECQPRLAQLGAILYDESFRVMSEINLIIRPDGFEIPESASSIHGITTEIATRYGLNENPVLQLFAGLMRRASVLVAHNIEFDERVMLKAFSVHNLKFTPPEVFICTMNRMTDVCKIPGPYGNKWPSLVEAHKHCFNEGFEGAHDAMADVRACARIYQWILKNSQPEVPSA